MPSDVHDIHKLTKQIETVRDAFDRDRAEITAIYSAMDPKHDARITAYTKTKNILNSVQLALVFISKHMLHNQWWKITFPKPVSDTDKQIYIKEFANLAKIAFVQGIFMALESSLRLFLRALDSTACNGGMAEFKSIYECLFRSKLSAIPADGVPLLDLLRLVRNTIHNNGVYFHPSGNDASVTWDGEQFEFKQGTPVDFVTWWFLVRVSHALRQLLRTVVEDANLKGITAEINDPFS